MLIKLAWRNIWRNKRRTGITMTSIVFAVVLSALMSSLKEGTYETMIQNLIGNYSGYIQVQSNDFIEEASIDNIFSLSDSIVHVLADEAYVSSYAPRLENFALAAHGSATKGVLIAGIDVDKEKDFSSMHEKVSEGEYLSSSDRSSCLLGQGLSEKLKIGVGDTIIVLSGGYHGASAAGLFHISGLIKFGSPELSKKLLFIPLQEAQQFFSADNMVSTIAISPSSIDKLKGITKKMNGILPASIQARQWQEYSPELENMIATDKVEGYVFMAILYMVIAFGIFGTVLMMLTERRYEFGVMISIGMKRLFLAAVVCLETLIITLLGALVGIALSFPVCYYFYYNPISFSDDAGSMMEDYGMEAILRASVDPEIFITQAIIVVIIATIISIYPFVNIQRLHPIKAMRA